MTFLADLIASLFGDTVAAIAAFIIEVLGYVFMGTAWTFLKACGVQNPQDRKKTAWTIGIVFWLVIFGSLYLFSEEGSSIRNLLR